MGKKMGCFVSVLLFSVIVLGIVCSAHSNGGLTLTEKDMLCINRQFNKGRNDTGEKAEDAFCDSIHFSQRWESMFPGRVELGIGPGGLRALAFKSKFAENHNIIFAFKDFLHEKRAYYIDDDYFQQIAMFGRELLEDRYGYILAEVCRLVTFNTRYWLGFDYHKHASAFVEEVLSRGNGKRTAIFTGYGFGGSIAIMQALRVETSSAITFAAHPVREVAPMYGYRSSTKRAVNLVLDSDAILGKGGLSTKQCSFQQPELYFMLAEKHSVFSDHGFVSVSSLRDCVDPIN